MQYTLFDLLKTEHILIGVDATNAEDAIRKLCDPLVQSGHALVGFAEDVWKREQTFPTGLPTQPIAIAIPHADPDHVNTSAVCIGILMSPVQFSQMGTDGTAKLDVHVVFLLAIKEREKQVEMIQQLVSLIQNPLLLQEVTAAGSATEVFNLIQQTLE